MKILNLYAGIGGNRKLWGDEHDITAVEYDENIAAAYSDRFPQDKVIVCDAAKFLLDNYIDYDFIWASPPCQSHSSIVNSQYTRKSYVPKYPDMTLYQIILFMQGHGRKCKWVIENVIPYYKALIEPDAEIGRHYYWSNFDIKQIEVKKEYIIKYVTIDTLKDFDISRFNIKNKRQVIRNQVDGDIGLHILNCAMKVQSPMNFGLFATL